jgi:hypothetical protein
MPTAPTRPAAPAPTRPARSRPAVSQPACRSLASGNACAFTSSNITAAVAIYSFTLQMCDNAGSPVCGTKALSITVFDVDAACSDGVSVASRCSPAPARPVPTARRTPSPPASTWWRPARTLRFCGIAADETARRNPAMQDSGSQHLGASRPRRPRATARSRFYYARLSTLQASHTFTANTSSQLMYPAIQCVDLRGSKASPLDATAAGSRPWATSRLRPAR